MKHLRFKYGSERSRVALLVKMIRSVTKVKPVSVMLLNQLWTDFTHCSGISIVASEQVNGGYLLNRGSAIFATETQWLTLMGVSQGLYYSFLRAGILNNIHYVKIVQIRSFSGPYSVQIRENTAQKNSVFEYFHAVICRELLLNLKQLEHFSRMKECKVRTW